MSFISLTELLNMNAQSMRLKAEKDIEQYETLNKLVTYLHARYPDSVDKPIVSHADIAYPYGRKTDPGKHFDFTKIGKEGL